MPDGPALITTTEGDTTVIVLIGEIDAYSARDLREKLLQAVAAGGPEVVVDLARTQFIDSTGIGLLVQAMKAVHTRGGSLSIRQPPAQAAQILRITGLDQILRVVE